MCVSVYKPKEETRILKTVYTPRKHGVWTLPHPQLCHSIHCQRAGFGSQGDWYTRSVILPPRVLNLSVTLPLCYCPSLSPHTTLLILSAPPRVTLPVPYGPGPLELRRWEPGWVAREKRRPQSKLRNLESCIHYRRVHSPSNHTRSAALLDTVPGPGQRGETDPWPQGVDGLWFYFVLLFRGLTLVSLLFEGCSLQAKFVFLF